MAFTQSRTKPTVLLLADRRQSRTARILKSSGYALMTTFTPDHAVAICVNNKVDAVVLDQSHFVETEGWSVAQSIKLIRHTICIILVVRGKLVANHLPEGVDAMVGDQDHEGLKEQLETLLEL